MRVSRRGFLGKVASGAAAGAAAGVPFAEPAAARPPGAAPPVSLTGMRTDRAWQSFLADQDLHWKRMPRTWYEGPFLGNGLLGSIVYQEPGLNALRFTVHHSGVQDHRPDFGNEWGVARLPVGNLLLHPVGEITAVDLRLDLWNAEISGTVTTDAGRLALRALVHNDRTMLLVTVDASAGEKGFRWEFRPSPAVSPRIVREPPPAGFAPNPAPVTRESGGIGLVVQPLVAGGQTATAYRERTHAGQRVYHLAVAHSYPGTDAEGRALSTVRKASALPVSSLLRTHRDWWHRFYRKSFLSVPDPMLQSFYWIQLYKLACGAREHAPVMATTGPWLEPTPWPSVWWNLNVQLEYWPVHGSNHLELDAIPRTLAENTDILVDALKPAYRHDSAGLRRSTDAQCDDAGSVGVPGIGDPEVGDLPWTLHNVWLTYRHTMDRGVLEDVLYPLLRRSTNYYLHFLHEQADGRLHLPKTFSPEYGSAPDCNYDLALLRWSCATLLETVRLLGVQDTLEPKWREVLERLVDPPVDANGFMIGAGVPFAKSHRHYSHLLAVYPLYLVNWEQPENRELIERSLDHWISFEGALRGYSFTGAASICTQMGRGDEALTYLRELVARFVQPNTMYYEAGPVVETPLSGAQTLHDMLCQSWGDLIRIFPGVPAEWRDVTLHDFRTQGAFLVSAVRRGGVTRWVRVRSLAGEPCRVRHSLAGRLTVSGVGGPAPRWRDLGDGVVELELGRDQEAVIHPAGSRPDFRIAPVRTNGPAEPWGLPALPDAGTVTQVDLVPHFDNDAITTEMYYEDGDFDGAGRTYPMAQLPQTGRTVDDGIMFSFTNGSEGSANNVVAAGQEIAVPPGGYARLHVLGAGDTGNVTVPAVAHYADGTTATVTVGLTNWLASGPAYEETTAVATGQIHTPAGPLDTKAAIFHQVSALDPARRLTALTLTAPAGTARAHVFALSLEQE
ncbi:twin-arginine translocation signal domain-containing protein [Streptomyces sp. NPDC059255]|uniref:glycosyl hydrolase family 95 catalytic domain-containing protein n=1 Tax=Streptomyces sp. NPDC059255 TaxID=3346793 RepID=UPI00369B62A0